MNVPQLRFKGFEGEWKREKLGKHLSFIGSGVTPRGGSAVYQKKEGIILIRSQNVHFSGIKLEDIAYITPEVNDKMKKSEIQELDVLLNITGASIGRSAMVPLNFPTANVNQHVCILRPNKLLVPYFLKSFLESSKGQKNVFRDQVGQTREALNLQQIQEFLIGIPSIEEQEKISSFLKLLNRKTNKQQEKIEELEEFKKGMMQKIFSQELRFKDEDGGEFPEWKRFKLGDIAIIKGRLGWKGLKQEEYVENGAYLVAGKHINKGIIQWDKCDQITDFRYKESIEIALEENDVIFSKDGSLGNPAIVKNLPKEATINSTMMLVRMIDEVIPDYLYQVLLGADFKRLIHLKVSGSSIPHLFQADMKDFEFLAPTSVKEQKKISCILKNLDAKIKKENEKLLAIKEQKKGFMEGIFI
ncbi:restriction endonuclease subunit S [Planococcus citreus]|uniref:Type I restriction enzyme S subunit n=1 Tax=Planococcus citreus TaxID=1373 RepID=A0A497YGC5_9BACL|nr:restriction endonuclease subunit S [Planococcus citreus]RLJ86622.1 type I restriction enzyme S subunit [Planococcus citreus]